MLTVLSNLGEFSR